MSIPNYYAKVSATDRMGHHLDSVTIIQLSRGAVDADIPKVYKRFNRKHPGCYIFVDRGQTHDAETQRL